MESAPIIQCYVEFKKDSDAPNEKSFAHLENVVKENNILSCKEGQEKGEDKSGLYVTENPLTPEANYFEIQILNSSHAGVAIGLLPNPDLPPASYHARTGRLSLGQVQEQGPKCMAGDRMGCGIYFPTTTQASPSDNQKDTCALKIFFTKNGKEISIMDSHWPSIGKESWNIYPFVWLQCPGEDVQLVQTQAQYNPPPLVEMCVDTHEDDWVRLHDVQLNGSVLEYSGRGCMMDVGLAQARRPLNTTNHYFEIEILDLGKKGYIAMGLTDRKYPLHAHPGWCKSSIAYHADDGKLFMGTGTGEPFGPPCHKGDIMGCGIIFPHDHVCDSESSISSDVSLRNNDSELEEEDLNSFTESDDEDWPRSNSLPNKGILVKVFFTRNHKILGHREIHIPQGGFFPTVGLLSPREKVHVDLCPMTG